MAPNYYRKAWDVAGWTFWADCYCAACGDGLPDIDPEGNAKHPVFASDLSELDGMTCGHCGKATGEW